MLPPSRTPGADLPVRAALPPLIAALESAGTAILSAPPGSGKTSLLPLALADALPGRVIVAEPRRIATRAAARRMAQLLGQPVGEQIGYSMRGDHRVCAATRIEVVTTGLLVRRLQHLGDLDGVDAVVIDEVHERALDTDLALAFSLDIRANLRPDLWVVATSATADTAALATLLGTGNAAAPIVTARGTLHPVQTIFAPPSRPLPLLADARVDPRLLDHVAGVVRRALHDGPGDVLVFLPGEAEIASVAGRLTDLENVLRLYGRQGPAEQDRALQPSTARRVVLTTAVAESSLTVPGVSVVVDAGLSREPRMDFARGLGALTTTKVSRSSATQRAGRAGREGPGRAYRCWSEMDDTHLDARSRPEIETADLAGFALAVADWGHPDGLGLALLDRPPAAAMATARALLRRLGALDGSGRITARGRLLAQVPATPRLARALLDGSRIVGHTTAAEVVALISGDITPATDDLVAHWRDLRAGRDPASAARWRQESNRLAGSVPADSRSASSSVPMSDDAAAAIVVALAFPDRIARRRGSGSGNYLMAGGSGAKLGATTALRDALWLAVAVADRPAGKADARIRLAVPLEASTAVEMARSMVESTREITWREGGLVLREQERLGAITLAERPLTDAGPEEIAAAVRDGIRRDGLGVLRWTESAALLRHRLALLHRWLGAPWPAVDDPALLRTLDHWLAPDLARVRKNSDLDRIDAGQALRRLLPWPAAGDLDRLVPERLEVPSGSRVRLDYSAVGLDGEGVPVLSVKVQEVFGWLRTPTIGDGRVTVLLHLLSPGGKPAAVTSDLASFWRQGYPQVRAELRSRYPRHAWPMDPLTATPSKRPARVVRD
jgi:ATP-dependent helicase HrpB